jgi:exosortase/archaeosortase family protein
LENAAQCKTVVGKKTNKAGIPAPAGKARTFREWWASRSPVLRFGVGFCALMALYYAVALTPQFDRVLFQCLAWNARASNAVLNLLGQGTTASELTIRSPRFAINVRRGCDAFEPAWFFCAAILAFPAPFRRKIAGILVGCVLIFATNIVRISSLYLIGVHWPRFFSPAHLEVWPIALILLAVFLWISWIGYSRKGAPDGSA